MISGNLGRSRLLVRRQVAERVDGLDALLAKGDLGGEGSSVTFDATYTHSVVGVPARPASTALPSRAPA